MKITRACILGIMALSIMGTMACRPDQVSIENLTPKTYTKLDQYGNPLPDQSKAWNYTDGSAAETNSDRWSCLTDDTTGLMWELKSHDGGLRDYRHVFTWYNSNPATNGGEHGIGDLGLGETTEWETLTNISNGTDDCYDPSRCDTEKYVADVNALGLCGYNDWRMPNKQELEGIVYSIGLKHGDPALDTKYFTDAVYFDEFLKNIGQEFPTFDFWTSTTASLIPHAAYYVYFEHVATSDHSVKSSGSHVRLVRGTAN